MLFLESMRRRRPSYHHVPPLPVALLLPAHVVLLLADSGIACAGALQSLLFSSAVDHALLLISYPFLQGRSFVLLPFVSSFLCCVVRLQLLRLFEIPGLARRIKVTHQDGRVQALLLLVLRALGVGHLLSVFVPFSRARTAC